MAIIENVKISYPSLATPRDYDGDKKFKYQVRIHFEKDRLDELSMYCAEGFTPKVHDDNTFSINIWNWPEKQKGGSNKPIVLNNAGQVMTDEEIKVIGNDSICSIQVNRFRLQSGKMTTRLIAVKVLKQVDYIADTTALEFEVAADQTVPSSLEF